MSILNALLALRPSVTVGFFIFCFLFFFLFCGNWIWAKKNSLIRSLRFLLHQQYITGFTYKVCSLFAHNKILYITVLHLRNSYSTLLKVQTK